ncbi:MAG: GDP-L-fucose synthase family protein [Candidatus Kapaibacteriales bacterium]
MKFNKDSKIFVAGAQGLVGSHVLYMLIKKGYTNLLTPSRKELDLRRQSDVEDFFEKYRPEFVILAAAKVGGILANNAYRAEFIYDNLAIAINVINSAYKFGVKKLINLGSSCIYPKFAPQPMKEEYLLTGSLETTNEAYAIAKIAAIKLCQSYNFQYGTNFISLMPTNLYGINDNFNLETSHVMPAMIRKFLLAKALDENNFDLIIKDFKKNPIGFDLDKLVKQNEIETILQTIGIVKGEITLWGSGKPRREFLYVDDLADACIYFLDNFDAKDTEPFVNIGYGEDISIEELAKMIKQMVGYEGKIKFDTTKPDGTPKKLLDITKAKSMGWTPKINLQEGIRRVVDNYLKKLNF